MATPTRLSPRLLHPLMGANLRTLWQIAKRNGGVAPECLPQLALAAGATILRWPFTAYERGLVARSPLPENTPPPIFIVGHWRSGTTFLYNLLSRSPQFAYVSPLATGLPWDFLTLARLVKPILEKALPKERFIDNVRVNPDSPQEDEIGLASMQVLSFYHGLYFPK
ncbi:MAG: sulfotransferase, partial [Cyanobacteria bacterium J06641_5]